MSRSLLRKLPVFAVSAILLALLAYGFWPVPIEVDVATVERGSFDVTVNDDGETRIKEKYIVSSPVFGKLLRVELHPGDTVQQGQTVLASIRPSDPALLDARALAEAEARISAAEASLLRANTTRDRVVAEMELTKHEYQRVQKLIDTLAVSKSQFDQAEHSYRMAQAALQAAEFSVRIAVFELDLAKAALVHMQPANENRSAPESVQITAPTTGRVLRVFQEDAGVVNPGTQLLEVGDPENLELVIDVLSQDAVRIRSGAKVLIDGWGGRETLTATVRLVEPTAFLKVSALGVEEKRVNVIADFMSPCEACRQLGDGFRIEGRIVVERAENVLLIPSGALLRDGTEWHVFRLRNQVAQRQPVEVGLSNGQLTEIRSGLDANDTVIIYPSDKIADGVRVEPRRE